MKKLSMMMKNNTLLYVAMVIIVLLMAVGHFQYNIIQRLNNRETDTVVATKIDTMWKDTTIFEKQFVPKYIKVLKRDTVFKDGDTLSLVRESKCYEKTLTIDKDSAYVEIYTSGIETSLDSLKMRLKTHTDVITNTVEITKYKKKSNFGFGVQVGYCLGLKDKNFQPFVGLGVSYNF